MVNQEKSIYIPAEAPLKPVARGTKTFTGDVYLHLIHNDPATLHANVTFTPCARTYWHSHEGGQLIRVLSGTGWVCDRGADPIKIKAGDTVWAPPGMTHWHGADEDSIMTHYVFAQGKTEWYEEVKDEEYRKGMKG